MGFVMYKVYENQIEGVKVSDKIYYNKISSSDGKTHHSGDKPRRNGSMLVQYITPESLAIPNIAGYLCIWIFRY